MVFAALVLASVVVPAAGQVGDNYRRVIGVPSGRNGYEELVAATDILAAGRFDIYYQLAEQPARMVDEAQMGPDEARIWQELKPKSLLQRRRLIATKFAKVLDLLEAASQKDIYDPRKDVDPKTLPELAGLKQIAKIVPLAAYCLFADGQTQRGVDLYVAGLDAFDKVSNGLVIQYLVGVACHSILLVSAERQLNQLSLHDASRLEAAILKVLGRDPAIRKAMTTEMAFSNRSIDEILKGLKPEEMASLLSDDDVQGDREKKQEAIGKLTAADKSRIVQLAREELTRRAQEIVHIYDGDEHDWMSLVTPSRPKGDFSSPEGVSRLLVDSLTPIYYQVRQAAVLDRTQIRLLGLACGVLRYKWENGQLPVNLEDAVGTDRARDPLSQQPFELRIEGQGFKILSKGTKETGEIGVTYKRQPAEPVVPPAPRSSRG